jgi:hypothetical protein
MSRCMHIVQVNVRFSFVVTLTVLGSTKPESNDRGQEAKRIIDPSLITNLQTLNCTD